MPGIIRAVKSNALIVASGTGGRHPVGPGAGKRPLHLLNYYIMLYKTELINTKRSKK
jgi:hypothetical protein